MVLALQVSQSGRPPYNCSRVAMVGILERQWLVFKSGSGWCSRVASRSVVALSIRVHSWGQCRTASVVELAGLQQKVNGSSKQF